MEEGDQGLSLVQCFYGSPSTCLWEDAMGDMHEIPQGEEESKAIRDALMPMLFNIELRKQCKGGCVPKKSCSRSWFAHPTELPMGNSGTGAPTTRAER